MTVKTLLAKYHDRIDVQEGGIWTEDNDMGQPAGQPDYWAALRPGWYTTYGTICCHTGTLQELDADLAGCTKD